MAYYKINISQTNTEGVSLNFKLRYDDSTVNYPEISVSNLNHGTSKEIVLTGWETVDASKVKVVLENEFSADGKKKYSIINSKPFNMA